MAWLPAVTTVEPASEPVTLADAKLQCRVASGETSYDDELNLCIRAARSHVETFTGTRIVTQTVALRTDTFNDFARLPVAPLQSISGITYVDSTGSTQTLSTSIYEARLFGLRPSVVLKYSQNWPSIQDRSLITVTAVAGYSAVPPIIHDAIRLAIAHRFDNKDMLEAGFMDTLRALLANHRVWA